MDNNSENNVADKKEAEYIIVYDESDNNSDSNLEEMNNLQDVNNSLLVNRRKLNQRVGTAGIIIMFLLIAASSIVYYVSTRKNNEHAQEEAGNPGRMERTAENDYDTQLDTALSQQTYDNTIARLSNDMAAKTLEIEQLLADIYKTQTDLVDDDYREQKADVIEAYKKAQEAVEDAKEQ